MLLTHLKLRYKGNLAASLNRARPALMSIELMSIELMGIELMSIELEGA